MNYTSFLIKIIDKPNQKSFKDNISVIEITAKFYQQQQNLHNICKLSIWNSFPSTIMQYYQLDDFLIVEGFISRRKSDFENRTLFQGIEITVVKLYPFTLNTRS